MNPPAIPPTAAPQHSGLATASMICGFLVIPTCLATALPAIIMGHIAWSNASKEGKAPGRAKLGLIFGYGSLALLPVIAAVAGLLAPLVIRQRQKADMVETMNNMRQIGIALAEYEVEHGAYPPDLMTLQTEAITTNMDELLRVPPSYPGDWLYQANANPETPDSPLLISPKIGRKHMTLQVDISVRSIEEDIAKKLIENPDYHFIFIPPTRSEQ